jgi:prolyl 4-hydroxylase
VQRACYLSNLTPAHAEPAQVVRYLPSQKYNSHCDWFDPAGATFEEKTRRGGQRVVTLLAYLREPTRGGRTTFPKLHLGFDPRVGDAVLWWNVDDDGKEDPRTLHAGEPVEAGEKFALNIWLRARPTRGEGGGGGGEEEEAAVEDDAAARAIEAST